MHLLFNSILLSVYLYVTDSVKMDNILACKTVNDGIGFDISFTCDRRKGRLAEQTMTFTSCKEQTTKFTEKILKYLTDSGRPRSLLVFINPTSGRKNGRKDYKKRVLPLLNLCGVKVDLKVTTKQNEPQGILWDYNLSTIDGIIAMGGDGFYSECMRGLILRKQKDYGVNVDDPTLELANPTTPIGIVPAGSGDYIVQYLHGTRCLKTAVLKILLGRTISTNAASVHEDGRLVTYCGLIVGFGLFGDMMKDCEKYRWMGPSRYNIVPLATMRTRQSIDVEVQYIPAKTSSSDKSKKYLRQMSLHDDKSLSTSVATPCVSVVDLETVNKGIDDEWKEIPCQRLYAVDTHPIAMVAGDERMQPHFGADSLTLTLTRKCGLRQHIEQLKKVKDNKIDCYDFKFVQQEKVDGYRVRLRNVPMTDAENGVKYLKKSVYINCDGDAIKLKYPEFEVRLHRDIVRLYGQANLCGS